MMISRSTEPRNTSGGGEAVGRLSDAGLVDAHSVAGDARTEHAVGEDGLTSDSSRSGATGSKAGAGASSGAASVAGVAAGAIVCASAAHAVLVARARVARARAEIEWTMVTARLGVGHGELGGPTSVGRRGGCAQMRHAMPAETAGGKPGRALPPRRSSQQESSHVKGRPPAAAESAGGVPTSHAHRPAKAVPHACRAAPARWSLMPWAALGKGAMGTALHRGDFRTRNRAARRV